MTAQATYKNFIPLSKVVNAAIIDNFEDKGKVEQLYYHWGARGLKKLDVELFKSGKKSVILTVNRNTRTATLPPDFDGELFVGVIDENGYKIPLKRNNNIVNVLNVEEELDIEKCPKCNTDKAICKGLQITVDSSTVEINGTTYEKTITKKMQSNGDYYLESSIPYLDTKTNSVIYNTSKEFITHIDLKDCGCVDNTASNINAIKACNPEMYCQYYAPCDNRYVDEYKIFEENGLIQFSPNFRFRKVYMEYRGFMVKINGQYHVPSIAFETLVEWIRWKAMGKKSISRLEKNDQFQHYLLEKSNMFIVQTRTSLVNILNAITRLPKFDLSIEGYNCFCNDDNVVTAPLPDSNDDCGVQIEQNINSADSLGYVPYSLGVIVGVQSKPVEGSSIYQSDSLKGAMNLNVLFLNDLVLQFLKGDFSFDTNAGTIDISPNKFYNGDVLTGSYFKKVVVPTGYEPYPFEVTVSSDTSVYQSNTLKGAYGFDTLFVNDTVYQRKKGDFSFDSDNGIIDFTPNTFFQGDVLTSSYYKKP